MDIGLVTAFLGGMLAILSPCGALLLPAFFASTVGAGPRLLLHGSIFYLGLLLVLVPLGLLIWWLVRRGSRPVAPVAQPAPPVETA
mgnify:CR=1 FL=1